MCVSWFFQIKFLSVSLSVYPPSICLYDCWYLFWYLPLLLDTYKVHIYWIIIFLSTFPYITFMQLFTTWIYKALEILSLEKRKEIQDKESWWLSIWNRRLLNLRNSPTPLLIGIVFVARRALASQSLSGRHTFLLCVAMILSVPEG